MDITAAQHALQTLQAAQQPGATPVDQTQIDAFTRALFGQDASTPEARAASGFQHRSLGVERALDAARDPGTALMQPLDMLANQSAMLRAILEVDLTAKAAGAVSQGINKLVNMQ
ncbi:type III secretion system protein [Burkholderia savannae]|uniref:type III secretion system inner rod subunit SctI n=1 Tax=Burkholderia savannae TaxID=1637837 RepID=UPI0007528B01|nr:type III secretion system inner rod subunit SctI [Burkholderia savannae]AOJ83903.1 type III secretion system protein [Burkholderia savannae]